MTAERIEEYLTVLVCRALQAKPATVTDLCAQFAATSKDRMRGTVGNLVRAGCVTVGKTRRHRECVYIFQQMPNPAKRPKLPVGAEKHAEAKAAVVRPYQPTFTPMRNRDMYALWRLCERDPYYAGPGFVR